MYPHRIRLRGPWECQPLARSVIVANSRQETVTTDLPATRKMTMPCGGYRNAIIEMLPTVSKR